MLNRAPDTIGLVYRQIGATHVFTAKDVKGLVHIGSHDRAKAFSDVMEALGEHVNIAYNVEAHYKPNMTYDDFSKHVAAQDDISGNFLCATLAHAVAA